MSRFFLPRHARTHLPGGSDPLPIDAAETVELPTALLRKGTSYTRAANTSLVQMLWPLTGVQYAPDPIFTFDDDGVNTLGIIVGQAGTYDVFAMTRLYFFSAALEFEAALKLGGSYFTGHFSGPEHQHFEEAPAGGGEIDVYMAIHRRLTVRALDVPLTVNLHLALDYVATSVDVEPFLSIARVGPYA
jgi:hypothetical protein